MGPDSSIDLGEHELSHGQVVVYHNGGGTSIGGLVDGQRYFVVIDDAERAFSASAVSSSKIDLGAGHGLEDGDKVIYRKANATDIAIGGLADELMYVIDVDGSDPDLVQLRSVIDDSVITLDATLSSASGHRFELVHPKIKLAASYADANSQAVVAA